MCDRLCVRKDKNQMTLYFVIGSGGEQPDPGGSTGPSELSGGQDPEGGGQTQRKVGQTQ